MAPKFVCLFVVVVVKIQLKMNTTIYVLCKVSPNNTVPYMNLFNFLSIFQVAVLVKDYQNSTEYASSQNENKRDTKKTDVGR